MKYKVGDEIRCSVSPDSCDPHDVFTVFIISSSQGMFKCVYSFDSFPSLHDWSGVYDRNIERYATNFLLAHSPLCQALK